MVTPQSGFLGNIDREFEEREIEKQAQAQKLGYVDFSKFAANPDILKLVSLEDAKNANAFPLSKNGKKIRKVFIPLKKINKIESYPFCFKNNRFYQFVEKDESWELHNSKF
jgi:hypothetical protein